MLSACQKSLLRLERCLVPIDYHVLLNTIADTCKEAVHAALHLPWQLFVLVSAVVQW